MNEYANYQWSLQPSLSSFSLFLPQVMSSQRVVRSLLSFVVQNDKAVGEWSSAQFEELQLLVGGADDRACCILYTRTLAHECVIQCTIYN